MTNFLKRLELQGFKSFAPKTVLDFPARIVAIVGPNGSGKSNIIDALRWVLGEREAKQLRGEKLENLIFSGTPKHPAAGLARVALYFDNKGKQLPLDFEEMAVMRKIDRSGTSQFFCNDAEVRLKDLLPILARARLSSRGLNMIGQGESDVFVKSTPEERRMMMEEVLGLREFRIKKNQSERRLENARINMDKVKAMLDELAPHLRVLRRQKNRFEKRNEVEIELRELENRYFSFHYQALEKELKDLVLPMEQLQKAAKEKQREIEILEKKLREIDKQSDEPGESQKIKAELAELAERRLSLQKNLARLEVKREFQAAGRHDHSSQELSDVIHALSDDLEASLVLDDLAKIKKVLSDWVQKLKNLFKGGDFSDLVADEKKLQAEISEIENRTRALRLSEEKILEIQKSLNQEFRRQIENLEEKKNALRSLEEKIQSKTFEKEKIHLRLGELEREWQSFGRFLADLKNLQWDGQAIDSAEAEKKMMRLRAELAAIGEIDQSLVKEAEESEKRHEFLSRELADLEKASTDLKNLIKELEERIHNDFKNAFHLINEEFNKYFRLMFSGGRAKLKLVVPKPKMEAKPEVGDEGVSEPEVKLEPEPAEEKKEPIAGVEIDLNLPKKKITNLEMLSGGERSLVSMAALFALIAVSPPPFLVLDEIDAALDEENARRFSELIKEFSRHTQFVIVTHNRSTMEAADALYGITMGDDGVSKVLSLKLESAEQKV
ncbi:MAG: Chromosome partition protein Smc [Candidatus Jorgensenbacteria bacterium GW2011_GWA1_48_11]|uniref:Chromosome partition protein Smc n=1 Tax=Candidatus Jorgensenbacteria bacterium GW2011_GWA1_48_11 TaxID=1618660 RepID=A0A0G1WKE7_9BACT|nr:MAG: Chromosome partition protein Smc [Candidatus Jorgensenbacteria bacterium GW2011_GWA1_48_11]KKW12415.1 MAG: Chromosome partition protein Smc [Candidatus Jorgensenbacteria bacterium GW2011_GWB1_49_9]